MELLKYNEDNAKVLYEQILTSDKEIVKVLEVDVPSGAPYKKVPKHWHRSLEIIIPKQNNAHVWVDGRVAKVTPNDFYIINSKQIHSLRTDDEMADYYGYAIQIKYDFLKSCFENIDSYYFEVNGLDQKKQLLNLLNQIIDIEASDDALKKIKQRGIVFELVYQLLSCHCFKKKDGVVIESDKKKAQLAKVLSYLDEHYQEVFDAQSIANHFHVSYGYLAHLFKTYLNTSMTSYVDAIRIHKAEVELLTTDKPITDIALDLGFANTKSFYREFRKYHQQTPKEYRKGNSQK